MSDIVNAYLAEMAFNAYLAEMAPVLVLNRGWLSDLEDDACTPEFCFVCRRCTDHFGEHSDIQLLAYANGTL